MRAKMSPAGGPNGGLPQQLDGGRVHQVVDAQGQEHSVPGKLSWQRMVDWSSTRCIRTAGVPGAWDSGDSRLRSTLKAEAEKSSKPGGFFGARSVQYNGELIKAPSHENVLARILRWKPGRYSTTLGLSLHESFVSLK